MKRKLKNRLFVLCCAFVTIVSAIFLSKTYTNCNMKYVLIWTKSKSEPFSVMGEGSEIFYKRHCPVQNCYISSDKACIINISAFDAILFHGPELMYRMPQHYFPNERFAHQSYIFTSMESSHIYNVPDTRFHGIFNFTWTYKLNSDISFKYMVIRDHKGKIIGPNASIDWISIDDMLPINDTIKAKLVDKNIAAAWFVSNCRSFSRREKLAKKIGAELRKYNMALDIYGRCGNKQCSLNYTKKCMQKLQRDYYFYLAFENSISPDYVTEKLRNALQNYVVPIVYGGADYTRFMPDGIYLNARQMKAKELVKRMVRIIRNKYSYYKFFNWHNHYSYHHPDEAVDTDPYCSLCSFLNNINQSKVTTIENFYEWWNPIHLMKLHQTVYKNITVL